MANTGTTGTNLFSSGTPSVSPTTIPEVPPEGALFTWHWLLAPLACAFIIFVCFECLVIRRRCKRRRYNPTRPVVPSTGGVRTYERYASSMDRSSLGGSSGLPSTSSLIPLTETREPLRVPCTVCGNSASGGSIKMGVSSYRKNRPFGARNPRSYKNPLYWYRVPLRELGDADTRTIRTVSSCTSVMTDTTSGGRSSDGGDPPPFRGATPTISGSVSSSASTEFRGNGYVIKLEAERDREIISPPVVTRVRRTPPCYESYRRRVQRGQIPEHSHPGNRHRLSENDMAIPTDDQGKGSELLGNGSLGGTSRRNSEDKGVQCNGHTDEIDAVLQELMTSSSILNIYKNPPGYQSHAEVRRDPPTDKTRHMNGHTTVQEPTQHGAPITPSSKLNIHKNPPGFENHRRERHHIPTDGKHLSKGCDIPLSVEQIDELMASTPWANRPIHKNPPGYMDLRNGHITMRDMEHDGGRLVMSPQDTETDTDAHGDPSAYRSHRRESLGPTSSNSTTEDGQRMEPVLENVADEDDLPNVASDGRHNNNNGNLVSREAEPGEERKMSPSVVTTNGHGEPPIHDSEHRKWNGRPVASSTNGNQETELPATNVSERIHRQGDSDDLTKRKGPPPPYKPPRVTAVYGGSRGHDTLSLTPLGWV